MLGVLKGPLDKNELRLFLGLTGDFILSSAARVGEQTSDAKDVAEIDRSISDK
jgi:hypothetical protein